MANEDDLIVPDRLRAALDAGERLIWWDRPKKGLRWQAGDAGSVPFAIAIWALLLNTIYQLISDMPGPGAIPMVLICLLVLAGISLFFPVRHILDAAVRKQTIYALTDRRLLIFSDYHKLTTLPRDLETIGDMTVEMQSGGFGTITIGRDFDGIDKGSTPVKAPKLELIHDPEAVRRKIIAARNAAIHKDDRKKTQPISVTAGNPATVVGDDHLVPDQLGHALIPGERLIWWSRPKRALKWEWGDLMSIPAAIFLWAFTGPLVLHSWSIIPSGASIGLLLLESAFFAAGLYLFPLRQVLDAVRRKRTIYALTNRRIIISTDLFEKKTMSLDVDSISYLTVETKWNGLGTIKIGPDIAHGLGEDRIEIDAPRIEFIRDADAVRRKIEAACDVVRKQETEMRSKG